MKQIKSFWTIFAAITFVIAVTLLPQCASESKTCNLPAPQSARLDSFSNDQTYISWSQVVGNNGYRIRIIEVDSPASTPAIIDTTVVLNDTNFVATNLPFNKRLEARISTICTNGEFSPKFKSLRIEGIIIVDEAAILRPLGTSEGCPTGSISINCYQIDKLSASVNFQTLSSSVPTQSLVINNFHQTPQRHYHVIIKKGNAVVSEFRLLYNLPPQAGNVYVISKSCAIKPPKNYNAVENSFKWSESSGGNVLRLIIDNANNRLILRSNIGNPRSFTVYSSTKYSIQCTKFVGIPND